VVGKLRKVNPQIKILLTVSPVPLTATNTGDHVLVASSASKAILRAVAETMKNEFDFIDYFPSYEIINSPVFKGEFFKSNLRQIEPFGVDFVMKSFFSGIGFDLQQPAAQEAVVAQKKVEAEAQAQQKLEDIACEEELLAQFATAGDKA
jgi:hypothetical protein